MLGVCLNALHRHPCELGDMPLEALWEAAAMRVLESERESGHGGEDE